MARKHNPTARMVGMQRNPTGSVEAFRSILKRYLPKLYSVSKSEYKTILDEFDQYPYDAKNFVLVAFDKLRHRRKALIKPSKDVPLWYEHVGRDLIPLGYFSSRSAALKTLGDNLALSYELRGGTAPDKAALVKAYLEQADVGPLEQNPRRNPDFNVILRSADDTNGDLDEYIGWASSAAEAKQLVKAEGLVGSKDRLIVVAPGQRLYLSPHHDTPTVGASYQPSGKANRAWVVVNLSARSSYRGEGRERLPSMEQNPRRNGKRRVSEKQTALFDLPAPAPKAKKGKKAKAGQEGYGVSACASTLVGTRWWRPPPPRARVVKCASKLAHTRWGTPMPTTKKNPAAASRNPSFARWLDTFLEEKEIDLEEVLEVKGKQWGTNYIPVGVLVQAMKRAPKHEQEAIKTMLVKIDFRNAPVRPYLAHLGQAIARNPRPNPGLTKAGKRHLIQTMHKAGADTFTKKMRYVRKHMPHITDPAAFVGYVMQGEKR